MIKKSNIIFSNLYGSQDPFISAAISRGDWLNTKKILKSSRQNIIETIKTFSFEKKIDFKDVAKLIRIAIVGKTNSPGIYDMMLGLGKLEVVRRFTILER